MDKKSQSSKLWVYLLIFIALSIGVYAYITVSTVTPAPTGGSWSVDRKLFINVTPTITNYNNFAACGSDTANVGANITQWDVNLSVNWHANGTVSPIFLQNETYRNALNGTKFQFNVSLPESDSVGFMYRVILTNLSSGGVRQNICGINYTEQTNTLTIKVDNTTPVIVVDRPLRLSNSTSNEIFFNATGFDRSPDVCRLYHNATGTLTANLSTSYSNGTAFGFTVSKFPTVAGAAYFWRCTDLAGNANWTNNVTFSVNPSTPTLTFHNPSNGSWVNTRTVYFNFTFIDNLAVDRCTLLSNFTSVGSLWANDASGNNQTTGLTANVMGISNGTATNYNINASLADTASTSGGYQWAVRCNNTVGTTIQSQNFSVFVDATAPGIFTMTLSNRTSSDHTPNFTITNTSETNFDKYSLQIANDIEYISIARNENYTTKLLQGLVLSSTNRLNASLETDGVTRYFWRVTAFDLAGNSRIATNGSLQYDTDEICYNLSSGYNYCGMVNEGLVTMDQIAEDSKAQFVYYWNNNQTASGFITHTIGQSTNAKFNLSRGDVVVLYINSTASPSLYENRTWAISLGNNTRYFNFNFTRANNSGYNLFTVQNETDVVNFTRLFQSFMAQNASRGWNGTRAAYNESMRYLSFINNSKLHDASNNQQFVPYQLRDVYRTYNAGVRLKYGEAYWIYNINYTHQNATKLPDLYWNMTLGGYG